MKLHPPTPTISSENPFKEDLFGRETFATSLTNLITNAEEGLVINIDANWGEGKTTFARMWQAQLQHGGKNCIYYDAYANDDAEDPFISFCAEIINLAEKLINKTNETSPPEIKTQIKALKDAAFPILKGIIKGGINQLTGGISTAVADELNKAKGTNYVNEAINQHNKRKSSIDAFKHALGVLASEIRQQQDNFPLLIIVDELDRCRPTFALSLIERIKHFFETPNLCFVLLTKTEQLESHVRTLYGQEVNARNYLHKFFHLSTSLPFDRLHNNPATRYSTYAQHLVEHHGIPQKTRIYNMLVALFEGYGFSLRQMEKCFVMLALYFSQTRREWSETTYCIMPCFLAVIATKDLEIFNAIRNGSLKKEQRDALIADVQAFYKTDNKASCFIKNHLLGDDLPKDEQETMKNNYYNRWDNFDWGKIAHHVIEEDCKALTRFSTAPTQ